MMRSVRTGSGAARQSAHHASEIDALAGQLALATVIDEQREVLRSIGAAWHGAGDAPDALAHFGIALAASHQLDAGLVLAELMLAYGAARDDQHTREWEIHLVRRMAELKGLHRIISAANSTLDLDTSLHLVVATVAEVMGVEACSVYLYDKDSDDLTLRATRGLDAAAIGQVRVAMNAGVTGAAAHEGRPVMVRDTWRDARVAAEPALGTEPFRAILAVPIVLFSAERVHIGAAKLQGVITIQTTGPREFTADEINFVETVAGELAFFVVNAQLYQQTDDQLHQKVRELTTLQQVSKVIAEQLNLEEVLKLIVAKSVELARADRADIFRTGDGGVLELAATHGGKRHDVPEFIAQAVRDARPLAVLNAFSDTRYPELAPFAAEEGFYSLFCMPLRVRQGRTIGAICLYTRDARHFDYEQVRLLSTFADEAAIAIENARLYEESQRALAIKSAMLQEMHHRVRNNLQTISALLAMQQRRLDAGSRAAAVLRDSVSRIDAIAGVHNLLCREDIGVTTVDAVARQIIASAQVTFDRPETPIGYRVIGASVSIGSREATVLAIVLNELVVNAVTHGLAGRGGTVIVECGITAEQLVSVDVRDDGPMHGPQQRGPSGSGMGLQIIRTLVGDDLHGVFTLTHTATATCARVVFPQRITDV